MFMTWPPFWEVEGMVVRGSAGEKAAKQETTVQECVSLFDSVKPWQKTSGSFPDTFMVTTICVSSQNMILMNPKPYQVFLVQRPHQTINTVLSELKTFTLGLHFRAFIRPFCPKQLTVTRRAARGRGFEPATFRLLDDPLCPRNTMV